jgi:hypothetical protein
MFHTTKVPIGTIAHKCGSVSVCGCGCVFVWKWVWVFVCSNNA